MAEITAALVKELREKTGAGMMDCKRALSETAGDVEGAVDWLRKKGLAAAAKKAGRVAAEGLVAVAVAGTVGAVVEVNAETDFVVAQRHVPGIRPRRGGARARHGRRHRGAQDFADGERPDRQRRAHAHDRDGRREHGAPPRQPTRGEERRRRVLRAQRSSPAISAGSACWWRSNRPDRPSAWPTLGRQLAMHVAAANPQYLDIAAVDAAALERERSVLREQARASGQGRGRSSTRWSRAACASSTRRSCCSSRSTSSTAKPASPRWSRRRPRRLGAPIKSRASSASPWARASTAPPPISRPRSRRSSSD